MFTHSSGGATAAAAAAARLQALRASGTVIQVEPEVLQHIIHSQDNPIIVWSKQGLLRNRFAYMTSHRGFVFVAVSRTPLQLPLQAEVYQARWVWVPQ
jgi:hypothetical protein